MDHQIGRIGRTGREREVRFSLLGPLQVTGEDGTAVEVRGTLRRTLLAELLLNAGSVVSADRLAELLWSSDPAAGRGARLHNQIARLRQDLGDAGARRVRAVPPGYLVEVSADELDLRRFAACAAAGRRAADLGDWANASAEYAAALALWRGAPLADLPALAADPVVHRLDEERWTALQGRIEADLNLGRPAEAAAELRALTRDQPLREGLHAQLMLALYQDGRQSEALEVFSALSRALADEAGLEPGADIRELHERIQRADPGLLVRGGGPASSAPTAPAGSRNQLPLDTRLFTGREQETQRLLALAEEAAEGGRSGALTISALDGLGGIGKSALAVRIAHRVSTLFPNGQLFIDLHGSAGHREPVTPLAALGRLLRSLDVPQQQIPADLADCSALLRDRLSGTRTLIVLDNAAAEAQVRPLLPDVAGCLVLITSRARLAIEGALALRLDVLSEAEAVALLLAAAGPGRLGPDDPAVAELAELCGRIPLALRIIAARLRHSRALAPADLADQLRDERGRLGELRDEDRDLADVLGTSYADLADDRQRAFRLLGLVPGADVDTHAAAALLDLDRHGTEHLFDVLLDRNLLTEATPGRYRMHDLVRLFAASQAEAAEHEIEREQALDRLLSWYTETANAAWRTFEASRVTASPNVGRRSAAPLEFPTAEAALAWFDRESGNLTAAVETARATGYLAHGLDLAHALTGVMSRRGTTAPLLVCAESGLDCAQRLGDVLAQSRMWRNKGVALFLMNRDDAALAAHTQAASLARAGGGTVQEADALVGLSSTNARAGRLDEALAAGKRAVALYESAGTARQAVGPLINMAAALHNAQRNVEALPLAEQAVSLGRDSGEPIYLSAGLGQLAAVMHATGDYDPEALEATYREAIKTLHEIGNARFELRVLLGYGAFLEETNRFAECVEVLTEAEQLGEKLAEPIHDKARDTLARARTVVTAASSALPSAP